LDSKHVEADGQWIGKPASDWRRFQKKKWVGGGSFSPRQGPTEKKKTTNVDRLNLVPLHQKKGEKPWGAASKPKTLLGFLGKDNWCIEKVVEPGRGAPPSKSGKEPKASTLSPPSKLEAPAGHRPGRKVAGATHQREKKTKKTASRKNGFQGGRDGQNRTQKKLACS